MNRVKGGISVFMFCFLLIQGLVIYEFTQVINRIAEVDRKVNYHYERLETKLEKLDKTS